MVCNDEGSWRGININKDRKTEALTINPRWSWNFDHGKCRDNADGIRTLKENVESVDFPVGEDEEYKDDSNEILKSIGAEEEEESDSDSNM